MILTRQPFNINILNYKSHGRSVENVAKTLKRIIFKCLQESKCVKILHPLKKEDNYLDCENITGISLVITDDIIFFIYILVII